MLVQAIVSVAGIALVVALVAWLGRGQPQPRVDEAGALEIARAALSGFSPRRASIATDGRAALVEGEAEGARGAGDAAALVRGHGAHWVVRRLGEGTIAEVEAGALSVRLDEAMFAPIRFALAPGEAARWAARIGALCK